MMFGVLYDDGVNCVLPVPGAGKEAAEVAAPPFDADDVATGVCVCVCEFDGVAVWNPEKLMNVSSENGPPESAAMLDERETGML